MALPAALPALALNPGFRFVPTESELVNFYLRNKVAGTLSFEEASVIPEVDLLSLEPWLHVQQLGHLSVLGDPPTECFFFWHYQRRGNGKPMAKRSIHNRNGYWRVSGGEKDVAGGSGKRKSLVFYLGKGNESTKTNWILHEYRLQSNGNTTATGPVGGIVLCRIFPKLGTNAALFGGVGAGVEAREEVQGGAAVLPSHAEEEEEGDWYLLPQAQAQAQAAEAEGGIGEVLPYPMADEVGSFFGVVGEASLLEEMLESQVAQVIEEMMGTADGDITWEVAPDWSPPAPHSAPAMGPSPTVPMASTAPASSASTLEEILPESAELTGTLPESAELAGMLPGSAELAVASDLGLLDDFLEQQIALELDEAGESEAVMVLEELIASVAEGDFLEGLDLSQGDTVTALEGGLLATAAAAPAAEAAAIAPAGAGLWAQAEADGDPVLNAVSEGVEVLSALGSTRPRENQVSTLEEATGTRVHDGQLLSEGADAFQTVEMYEGSLELMAEFVRSDSDLTHEDLAVMEGYGVTATGFAAQPHEHLDAHGREQNGQPGGPRIQRQRQQLQPSANPGWHEAADLGMLNNQPADASAPATAASADATTRHAALHHESSPHQHWISSSALVPAPAQAQPAWEVPSAPAHGVVLELHMAGEGTPGDPGLHSEDDGGSSPTAGMRGEVSNPNSCPLCREGVEEQGAAAEGARGSTDSSLLTQGERSGSGSRATAEDGQASGDRQESAVADPPIMPAQMAGDGGGIDGQPAEMPAASQEGGGTGVGLPAWSSGAEEGQGAAMQRVTPNARGESHALVTSTGVHAVSESPAAAEEQENLAPGRHGHVAHAAAEQDMLHQRQVFPGVQAQAWAEEGFIRRWRASLVSSTAGMVLCAVLILALACFAWQTLSLAATGAQHEVGLAIAALPGAATRTPIKALGSVNGWLSVLATVLYLSHVSAGEGWKITVSSKGRATSASSQHVSCPDDGSPALSQHREQHPLAGLLARPSILSEEGLISTLQAALAA